MPKSLSSLKIVFSWLMFLFFLTVLFYPVTEEQSRLLNLAKMMQPPSFENLLGTDSLGRDLLARIIFAMQHTLPWIWLGVSLAFGLGIFSALGIISSIDDHDSSQFLPWISRIGAVVCSFPITVAVLFLSLLTERTGLSLVVFALLPLSYFQALLNVLKYFQLDRKFGYWQASQSLGQSPWQTALLHGITLNWRSLLVGHWLNLLKLAVFFEATVSYLGFGTPEPTPSLGNILASHWDFILRGDIWLFVIFAGALIIACHLPSQTLTCLSSLKEQSRRLVAKIQRH